MAAQEWANKARRDIKRALREFGRHSFNDKGAHEVMEVPTLDGLSASEAQAALLEILDSIDIPRSVRHRFVFDVLLSESGRPDFDALCSVPRLAKLYAD